MSRTVLPLLLGQLLFSVSMTEAANPRRSEGGAMPTLTGAIDWHTDYAEAMRIAKAQRKMMFVWFYGAPNSPLGEQYERVLVGDTRIRQLLNRYVSLKLPTDAVLKIDGKPRRLLDHGAFQELYRSPGIAIIDFANRGTEHYGYVVNAVPFTAGKYYRFQPDHLAVLLNLPAGTLTQRTLVFAVRIHPERPASTLGELDPNLVAEATNHSRYQASIRVQGHHNWGHRFPRLARVLFGLRPQEIVAESWPQERLVDAAVDVVDSWHHSSGHWQAVYSPQNRFGYDMQKGTNGIWYATGLFGNTH